MQYVISGDVYYFFNLNEDLQIKHLVDKIKEKNIGPDIKLYVIKNKMRVYLNMNDYLYNFTFKMLHVYQHL